LAKKAALNDKMAFIAALAFTFTPLGFASTFLATTDCGSMLFWTLACAVFVDDLMQQRETRYCLIGLLIGLGALFKWTAFLLWIAIIPFSIHYRRFRYTSLFLGLFISFMALVPSLIWNFTHNFATFRHVAHSLFISNQDFSQTTANPLSFIGAQFGLLSPIIMALLVIALFGFIPLFKKLPPSLKFCFVVTILSFVSVLLLSLFKKVQGNWAVFAYPTGFVLLMAFVAMRSDKFLRWVYAGMGLSLALVISLLSVLVLERYTEKVLLPYRMNPFRDALGWGRLEQGLATIRYNPSEQFLFSDRYQITSIASFYSPGQKRAYFFNIRDIRNNQFSYWPQMSECEVGKTGYYIGVVEGKGCLERAFSSQQSTRQLLKDYFTTVSPTPILIPLVEVGGEVVKAAYLIKCEDYNGKEPQPSNSY
jgi:hypothetical protein